MEGKYAVGNEHAHTVTDHHAVLEDEFDHVLLERHEEVLTGVIHEGHHQLQDARHVVQHQVVTLGLKYTHTQRLCYWGNRPCNLYQVLCYLTILRRPKASINACRAQCYQQIFNCAFLYFLNVF